MTSLIHFTTSINTAQVVVVGSGGGTVSWYISQPPQKTFSLLYNTHCHAPHPVVSLQVRYRPSFFLLLFLGQAIIAYFKEDLGGIHVDWGSLSTNHDLAS